MRKKLEKEIYNAFFEFMVTRFRIPKKAVPAYWEIFYKSLEWRIKNVIILKNGNILKNVIIKNDRPQKGGKL